jgi:hypothetical protein
MYKLTGRVNKYLARQHRLTIAPIGVAHSKPPTTAPLDLVNQTLIPALPGPPEFPISRKERIEPPLPKDQGAKLHSEKARLPTPI